MGAGLRPAPTPHTSLLLPASSQRTCRHAHSQRGSLSIQYGIFECGPDCPLPASGAGPNPETRTRREKGLLWGSCRAAPGSCPTRGPSLLRSRSQEANSNALPSRGGPRDNEERRVFLGAGQSPAPRNTLLSPNSILGGARPRSGRAPATWVIIVRSQRGGPAQMPILSQRSECHANGSGNRPSRGTAPH